MLLSGIQKFTLLDYPDKTACIVFTPGCNFRCGYCHNSEFVLPEKIAKLKKYFIPEMAFFNFLEQRRGLLDGVVITGGEPTMMPDLIAFMLKIKQLGFLVKLDTNGNRPDLLRQALQTKAADYIAMDVKTSLPHYQKLVGSMAYSKKITESVDLLKTGAVEYEFRATLIREIHSPQIITEMIALVAGARKIFLQSFRSEETLDPTFRTYHPFSSKEMAATAQLFSEKVFQVVVR